MAVRDRVQRRGRGGGRESEAGNRCWAWPIPRLRSWQRHSGLLQGCSDLCLRKLPHWQGTLGSHNGDCFWPWIFNLQTARDRHLQVNERSRPLPLSSLSLSLSPSHGASLYRREHPPPALLAPFMLSHSRVLTVVPFERQFTPNGTVSSGPVAQPSARHRGVAQ